MSKDFLQQLISTIVFLLPVLGLVQKGAKLASRLEQLEINVQEKTDKFCRDHREMEQKMEQERLATDTSITAIMSTLTEIQKSLVRVETKLEEREK